MVYTNPCYWLIGVREYPFFLKTVHCLHYIYGQRRVFGETITKHPFADGICLHEESEKFCGSLYYRALQLHREPGSSVSIATGYGLDGPVIESRWGARFSAPVQTGPGTHPAPCTRGTRSFPGVKSGRGMMLTPHPLLVPWS